MWDNYFTDVAETKEDKGKKLYKGQRLKKMMKNWGGIGTLKFADGTLYQGQT